MMEQEMITEIIANPLHLSLDEIIALNKIKNENKIEEELELDIKGDLRNIIKKPDRPINGHVGVGQDAAATRRKMQEINKRLSSQPGFGTKGIHERLGYFKRYKKSFSQARALKSLSIAKKTHLKNLFTKAPVPEKPVVTVINPDYKPRFVSPLTRSSVMKFNKLTNGVAHNGIPSDNRSVAFSATSAARQPPRKFSILRALSPRLQAEIAQLSLPESEIDPIVLENFCPTPHLTGLTLNERISQYI